MRLERKRAIVTGGASGIGEAIARRFVAEGASVVIADVQEQAGHALVRDLHPHALFQRTDVTSPEDIAAAVTATTAAFGGIDVIVNNAGWVKVEVAVETETADFDRMLATYVRAHFLMAKHALPVMIEGGGGSIVNMSSMQAYRAIPGRAGVQAAKGAICSLTRELALEYGPAGVRVNAVLPGLTMTDKAIHDYAAYATPEELDLRRQCYPLRRFGTPADIANAVLFLASDESAWITGIDLLVDGGISMQLAEAVMFPPFRRLWQKASPSA
jgi:NAD(P)-dependent dehydrogenase (short-subunit alcohol dehydrogenase family)